MSIHVFITRKENPIEDAGPAITEQEWRSVATDSPDFRLPTTEDLADSDYPGGPTERDLIWTGHNEEPVVWFVWYDGQVEVENADESVVARMKRLAELLGARVVSETGEQFDDLGQSAGFEPWSEFYDEP